MNDNTFGMELHFHDDLSSRNLVKETQVIFMLEGAAQITIEQTHISFQKMMS